MRHWHIALAGVLALTSAAAMAELAIPGGKPEGTLQVDRKAAGDKIASACFDRSWQVTERSEFLIVCKEAETGSVFNQYTRLQDVARFSLLEVDGKTRVRGESVQLTTNGFGQVSESAGDMNPAMISLLEAIGAEFPPGTLRDATPFGLIGGVVDVSTYRTAFIVDSVTPGSPAEAAGLQAGDEIRKLERTGFSAQSFLQTLADSQARGSVSMEVLRGKARLPLTMYTSRPQN